MQTTRITLAMLIGLLAGCQTTHRAAYTSHNPNGNGSAQPQIAQDASAIKPLPNTLDPSVRQAAFVQPADAPPEPEPLALPTPAIEPASDLTLQQLEQIALASNPSVARAAAQLNALQGKWVQAGLPPNPRIGYAGEEIGDDGTAGQQGGFVGQRFITGGKLGLNRAVVSQEVVRAEQHLAAQQQRVLTDVRTGYYDVLIAQRQLDLARELVGVSNQAVNASQELVKAKEIPRVGLLQTEVEAENARILLRRAENGNVAAWRRLTSVLGRPTLAPQRLVGDLDQAAADLNWAEQLQRLVTQSPEIAGVVAELERARWALDRAYAEVTPDLNVQVAVQHDNATDDTIAGIQVGLPIPLWNKNQGGIQQARSEIAAAERNIERVELDLRQRLATAFQQYADAKYQVERFSTVILPKAKETFDLVTKGYTQGEVGYLDMLTAQRTYFQTNLSYIEALRELWRATLRIDGMLLEGSLASDTIRPEQ